MVWNFRFVNRAEANNIIRVLCCIIILSKKIPVHRSSNDTSSDSWNVVDHHYMCDLGKHCLSELPVRASCNRIRLVVRRIPLLPYRVPGNTPLVLRYGISAGTTGTTRNIWEDSLSLYLSLARRTVNDDCLTDDWKNVREDVLSRTSYGVMHRARYTCEHVMRSYII